MRCSFKWTAMTCRVDSPRFTGFVQAQINWTTQRHIGCSALRDVAYRSKACRKSRHIVQVSFGRPIDASNFLTNTVELNVFTGGVSNLRRLEERG